MINPAAITAFNCSSYYWIPAKALCNYIVEMFNLTELIIQDTRISLENLPRVFKACQQIVKLSFTVSKQNLKHYVDNAKDDDEDWIINGFHRVTHLKIFTCLFLSRRSDIEPWIPTLRVLT